MKMRSAEDIYRDYEAEVIAIFPQLELWWDALSDRTFDGTERKDRWPMGPVAHPRFIEIFRRYFVEILERNQKIEESSPDLIHPQSLLIEQLAARHPKLSPRIKYFVFIPIGGDDEPEPLLIKGGE